ncbi:Coiled-coil domain-containing protein 39 [Cichlidogyrus casuarinus]|uniref:Coiled-coil domain-containing protein 39 n=1 Tax=Cichlidogyrus casuarinus TaxID=1844966 RepID=A0ABD2QH06_9PLAT
MREELVKKLELLQSNTMTTEQMAKESEARHKAEEDALKNHHFLMQKLRDEQFQKSQEIFKSNHDFKTHQNILLSCKNLLRTLNSKLEKIDKNILRQQEIIYNQDYTIQQFERRIGRMKGEIKEEDRANHEAQLKVLDGELDQAVKSLEGMRNQLEFSETDLRRVKRDIIKIKKDEEHVQTLLKTQDVQLESCEKELVKLKADRKEILVEKNMLEVDIEQLKKAQEKNIGICTDVEKDRSQLETSLKLKMKEIVSYEQMVKSEKNMVSQENSNLRMEIQSRNSKIEKLMNRYEIINYSMMGAQGMEEDRTQAYYVIKAAQEREALQRHGDRLDAEIRKLERETHAMQNTLDVMKGCNQAFRQGHKIVNQSSEEIKELQDAQELFRNQFALLKTTKAQYKELSDNCTTLKGTCALLSRDSELFETQLENLKREDKIRQADVNKMSERLHKTLDSLRKLKRKCAVKFDESKVEKTKRDIEVRTFAIRFMLPLDKNNDRFPREYGKGARLSSADEVLT